MAGFLKNAGFQLEQELDVIWCTLVLTDIYRHLNVMQAIQAL